MTQNHYQVSISEMFLQESWSGGFRTVALEGLEQFYDANHYQVSVSEVLFSARPRCPGGAGGAPGETPLRFVGLEPTAVHPTHAMAPRGWRPRGAGLGPRSSPIGAPPPSPRHPATLPSRSVNN